MITNKPFSAHYDYQNASPAEQARVEAAYVRLRALLRSGDVIKAAVFCENIAKGRFVVKPLIVRGGEIVNLSRSVCDLCQMDWDSSDAVRVVDVGGTSPTLVLADAINSRLSKPSKLARGVSLELI